MSQNKWINVVLSRENYDDLKLLGEVPESFNYVIGRLLKEKQPVIKAIRAAKTKQQEQLLKVSW
jgi:predicted DNA-binding protein (MmcQ/YjbR family)